MTYFFNAAILPRFFTLIPTSSGTIFGTRFGTQICMNINITQRLSKNGKRVYYSLEWGKAVGNVFLQAYLLM